MDVLTQTKRAQIVGALVDGVSINATCRITGVAKHTVLKLLKDMGCALPRSVEGDGETATISPRQPGMRRSLLHLAFHAPCLAGHPAISPGA